MSKSSLKKIEQCQAFRIKLSRETQILLAVAVCLILRATLTPFTKNVQQPSHQWDVCSKLFSLKGSALTFEGNC